MPFSLEDYVDVAERLRLFHERYPDGRIRTVYTKYKEWGPITGIKAKAKAYRTPEDPKPAIGTAWEPVPGKTQFTRDSEVQNAETAAWGRAIVAAGIGTKRIASLEEVRNRDTGYQAEVVKSPRRVSSSPARVATPSMSPTTRSATPDADEPSRPDDSPKGVMTQGHAPTRGGAESPGGEHVLSTADLKLPPAARYVITKKQIGKMWDLAHGYRLSDDQVREIMLRFAGVEHSDQIQRRYFDAILKEIDSTGLGTIA